MPDFLTTFATFINSPPGQIAAGSVLAGIVWKFFERVEGLLTDSTKFEIAVWLVGVKVGPKVEPWPDTNGNSNWIMRPAENSNGIDLFISEATTRLSAGPVDSPKRFRQIA